MMSVHIGAVVDRIIKLGRGFGYATEHFALCVPLIMTAVGLSVLHFNIGDVLT